MTPKTPRKPTEATKRAARAQQDRSPMLAVRIPRSLHRAFKAAARADRRTLADWLRLNLPKLLPEATLDPALVANFAFDKQIKDALEHDK